METGAVDARGLDLRDDADGVTLSVRVVPRSSREGFGGEREGALVVRLTAPPVEGAANEALQKLLGRTFGVPPKSVAILSGATGRNKRVHLPRLDRAQAQRRIEEILAAGKAKGK